MKAFRPRRHTTGPLSLLTILATAALAGCSAQQKETGPPQPARATAIGGQRLSGPYTHANLSVLLVHAADRLPGATYLTLQEALEQQKAIVHETGNVNELAVENLSGTDDLFIQAGDIVSGGQQDRTIELDLIVPPNSGRVPIGVFCVEAGRWSQRGSERAGCFDASGAAVVGSDLKLAVRAGGSQSAVWGAVRENQAALAQNLNADVTPQASESSLWLTVQSAPVQESVKPYVDALAKVVDDQPDALGVVFAVNGRIRSADTYGSRALFLKLWPKLLQAAAIEALAAGTDEPAGAVTPEQAAAFLAAAGEGQVSEREASPRVHTQTRAGPDHVLFRTVDRGRGEACVHESVIAKD